MQATDRSRAVAALALPSQEVAEEVVGASGVAHQSAVSSALLQCFYEAHHIVRIETLSKQAFSPLDDISEHVESGARKTTHCPLGRDFRISFGSRSMN